MKAQVWKTVRVFISSTFRDMQAERDHLVRFVFPRLREKLLPRHIHLVDVDLRWGVTSDQDVSEVCREIIDECRPRFLCMLGGRYGWVPPGKTRSITADEVHYGVLDRTLTDRGFAYFYFRDEAATVEMAETAPGELREPQGSDNQNKLAELKQAIIDEGLNPFTYPAQWDNESKRLTGLKKFGDRIYEDLLSSMKSDPELRDRFVAEIAAQLDEFTEENAAMEAFVEERSERFVLGSRGVVLDELLAHASATGANGYICLTGAPGSGKSALLAYLYHRLTDSSHPSSFNVPHPLVICHFVGASPGSTDMRRTVRRLCHALKAGCPNITSEIPEDPEKLRVAFQNFLRQACVKNHIIILIDAINQFNPASHSAGLYWLPEELPPNARVILSALDSPALEELRRRPCKLREIKLKLLTAEDCEAIIEQFRKRYSKNFERDQRTALLTKTDAGMPLYLLAALEELRTLGTYEEITRRINELPPTTHELFAWILERLEKDDGFRDVAGRRVGHELVSHFAALLGASRHGLSQRELADLLAPGNTKVNPPNEPDPQGNVAALLHLLRPYLMWRGELLDFYHGSLTMAVRENYIDGPEKEQAAHLCLGEYFEHQNLLHSPSADRLVTVNRRKVEELPYQYTAAQNWIRLTHVLRDLQFMEAKATAGLMDDLLDDYLRAQTATNHPLIRSLAEVRTFVLAQAHILRRHPSLIYQQAANQPTGSLIAILAQENSRSDPWLRWLNKPERRRSCLLEFATGTKARAIAAVDGTFRRVAVVQEAAAMLFDLETGAEIITFPIERDARVCRFSHDGTTLLLGYPSGFVTLWDTQTGHLLRREAKHRAAVTGIDVSSHTECSVAADGTVALWDSAGNPIGAFSSSFVHSYSCALHPHKPRVIIGGPDARLEYWDYQELRCLANMTGSTGIPALDEEVWSKHQSPIVDCQFSPEGKLLIAAQDGQCTGAVYVLEIDDDRLVCPYSFHGITHKLGFLNRCIILEGGFTACTVGPFTGSLHAVDSMRHLVVFDEEKRGYRPRFVPGVVRSRCILCRQAPNGQRILTVDNQGRGRLWDLSLLELEGLSEPYALIPVHGGAVSPIRPEIVVCRDDGSLVIWDATRRHYGAPFGGDNWYDHARTCVGWTHDGERLLAGGEEDYRFDLWTREGKPLANFRTSDAFPIQCEMAPDDSVGAFVTRNGTIAIRSLDKDKIECVLHRADRSIENCKFVNPAKVIICWNDGVVLAWDWQNDRICWQKQMHRGGAVCDCNSKTGRVITAGKDGLLLMQQAATGNVLREINLGESIQIVTWSPCGRWLAVCAADLLVIDVEAWDVRYRWCLDKPLVFVGFLPEPGVLACGNADGEIALLRIEQTGRR